MGADEKGRGRMGEEGEARKAEGRNGRGQGLELSPLELNPGYATAG